MTICVIAGQGVCPPVVLRAQENASSSEAVAGNGESRRIDSLPLREELEALIRAKAGELEKINRELETTQTNLKETKEQGATLQQELKNLQYAISQLELNMKADEITAQKLGLEIGSLNYDIRDIGISIANKQEAITYVLRELQKNDRTNLLIIFLKNDSLADSFLETQSLKNLKSQLAVDIANLTDLHGQLNDKLETVSTKKTDVELHQKRLADRKAITQDQRTERNVLLTQTKNQEKIYQQQLSELEKLRADVSVEIEKIESELRSVIDPNLLPIPRPGVLLWPVVKGITTQGYGSTPFALRNYKSKHHNGIDIGGVSIGTEVLAAEKGRIINVGDQDKFCRGAAYGKFVVIKHENGLTTLYAHLSRTLVSVGETVGRGDVIGYLGKTGWATGPHLHFTVFASQTITPARPGVPEGAQPSRYCGPMPVGGDLDPTQYL